ncbi:LysR substrate-binding domain-containing protein [Tabrizicola sp. J26]|uniref:LysR substrate-binding domain-containing protein n=1 Tax=Alitabrizicola rongguiensis TaxID=2909234 RepID=UPI001F203409|nr:LysR substrate-binding domain-containing protein [Tabrizicola rongguiensis]MCF1710357.1 LysR substrate-binding domain-containing protein [Tabrizicola rongguiensis]
MTSLPPLNFIRSFEAAARHQSFTRAAAELALTQAAVSGHVRALEDFIGRPLFHRSPRNLVLTEIGAAWLPGLRQALAQIEAATGQILNRSHRQEVTISCPASLATNWLPARLRAFRDLHPGVDVTVHATIWAEPGEQIADLRITPRQRGEQILGTSLQQERLVMVCASEFLSGPDALTTPADVARKGMIHVLGRPDHWEAFACHHGLTDLPLERGPKTDSSNVALEMAVAGLGCAITVASLAEVHLSRGLLVAPFPGDIPSNWVYDLHLGDRSPTRAAEALVGFLLGKGSPAPRLRG